MSQTSALVVCTVMALFVPATTGLIVATLTRSLRAAVWSAGVSYASSLGVFSVTMIIYGFASTA